MGEEQAALYPPLVPPPRLAARNLRPPGDSGDKMADGGGPSWRSPSAPRPPPPRPLRGGEGRAPLWRAQTPAQLPPQQPPPPSGSRAPRRPRLRGSPARRGEERGAAGRARPPCFLLLLLLLPQSSGGEKKKTWRRVLLALPAPGDGPGSGSAIRPLCAPAQGTQRAPRDGRAACPPPPGPGLFKV